MKTARPWESRYDVFKQIISEETPAYFNGDKSAEEVARIVQNRAQLYLDEK